MPELLALVTERVQASQGPSRVGRGTSHLGSQGAVLSVNVLHESLAELERRIRENRANADFQSHAARLAALCRQPPANELYEDLVPFLPT